MRRTVAIDASFLTAMLDQRARTAAVADLILQLSRENAKVIVTTPALADFLKHAGEAGPFCLDRLNKCACFQVRPFDDKASIELARLLGEQAAGLRDILRFDRQIVAIAKVYGAATLYADNEQVAEFAAQCGVDVKRFKDLG